MAVLPPRTETLPQHTYKCFPSTQRPPTPSSLNDAENPQLFTFFPLSTHPDTLDCHRIAYNALGYKLSLSLKMTQFFVQLPEGNAMALDLDLDRTTVAAVKVIADAHLESVWRASGVRILRSDLPFCGIRLIYQNRILAMDKVLSSCKVGKESTLYVQWPQKSEKYERRRRYGKGWDNEPALETRIREERELKRAERKEKSAEKEALRGATKKRTSKVVENTTQSAPETGEDEQISSECVSDDGPGDQTEVEAEGGQGLSEEIADEEQDEQQEGQEERPTGEVEQNDPFADEDDDKENRAPEPFAPVVENRVDDYPAEEWLAIDRGLGMGLLEEVLEF